MAWKNIYFIGIGGIGMSAIARYFKFKGYCVGGYDRTPSDLTHELEKEGISVHYEDNVDCIPKNVEDDYIFHLDEETYEGLWAFARKVALAVKAAVPCKRVGVAVLGMEVPHTHIHLVPLQTEGDLDFRKTRPAISPEQMAQTAAAILSEYEKLQ